MPRSANQKLKLLCLCRILWERTDEDHPLTVPELIQALEAWDIKAERKSIYDDMEALRTLGMDVQSRKGKSPGWFLGERTFQLAELKLLVDAVQSTWNDISKLDIPSLTDLDDATLTALYGIDPADLDSYLCKMPMVNVQATEFFIAKVKDGKMDTVKAAVEKRQDDLEAQWSQYLPEQLELVQNYKLVTNGNYILFAVSEYADQAVTAFNTYTK